MKKIKLIVILLFLFFAQKVHCGQNNMERHFSCQDVREDESHFEANEFSNYSPIELPTAQIFLNFVPETTSSSSLNFKTKVSGIELFHSKTKINPSLSTYQESVYSRYSSSYIQIFLKTACFRL